MEEKYKILIIFPSRVTLNKCMIDFMKPKLKFEELSRFQRISCIKVKSLVFLFAAFLFSIICCHYCKAKSIKVYQPE